MTVIAPRKQQRRRPAMSGFRGRGTPDSGIRASSADRKAQYLRKRNPGETPTDSIKRKLP